MKNNNAEQTTFQSVKEQQEFISTHIQLNKQIETQTQFGFTFQTDQQQVLYIFEEVASELDFNMIEKQQNYATAIKTPKKGRFDFLKCLSIFNTPRVTAIKISLYKSTYQNKKFAIVKGLIGSKPQTIQFIKKIKQKTQYIQTNQSYLVTQQHRQVTEEPSNPFYIQICANYMFKQILSNLQSKVGKSVQKQIQDFEGSFKNIKQSVQLLPIPMKNAITMINETYHIICDQYSKNEEVNKVMQYCRVAIQAYIFQKIQKTLQPIYQLKNQQTNRVFQLKKIKIFEQLNLRQILEEVSLNQNLWFQQKSKLQIKLSPQQACEKLNFKIVVEQINKINFTGNPRQKIKYLQLMYTRLKSLIFQKSNNKIQLFNMEDIIPSMILIVLFCEVNNLRSQIDIMYDFIQFDSCDMEAEKRIVVNISQSYNYVVRDWKI